MIELYSYTGDRIAKDVKDTFGDTGGVQLLDDMLLRWINDGIREISTQHDFSRDVATADVVALQSVYDIGSLFQAERIKQVQTVSVDNRMLDLVPLPVFLRRVQETTATEQTGTPRFGSLEGQNLRIWPVTSVGISAGIQLSYSKWPTELERLADSLPLPDRFVNSLTDFVLTKAYQLADKWEQANQTRSNHDAGLRREFERDSLAPTDFYPSITYVDDYS